MYHNQASEEEKPQRVAEIKTFLAHFNKYVKSLDPVNATTIGHTFAKDIEWCPDVDVSIKENPNGEGPVTWIFIMHNCETIMGLAGRVRVPRILSGMRRIETD